MAFDIEQHKADRNQLWRSKVRESLKAAQRSAIQRVFMPAQDGQIRSKNHEEVNLGLTNEMAIQEASRCLDCTNPTCISGCPVEINIPKFIKYIEAREFKNAVNTIKESNLLPGVCGRVCPQEKQCESMCIYTQKMKKDPVAIGYLERFAADYNRINGSVDIPEVASKHNIKVAAIGSGPAGLAFAADMAKNGFDVTVFEALHDVGGVLKYGIPEFRLPNEVVESEVEILRKMGVEFRLNCLVGRTYSLEDLRNEGFKAFFVGSGAGLPNFMNIPGENLVGVMSSNEYLTRVNLMGAGRTESDTPVLLGKRIAVIGGGNTAMDAVRTAKRLGAEEAVIIYRRTEDEMPARIEEVHHAKEEGIRFLTLHNPVEYQGNERGRLSAIRCVKMELGEPDASGRRKPVATNQFVTLEIDIAIVSIGVSPNPIVPSAIAGLNTTKWGTIVVNHDNMQTTVPDVFAGGDIVRGGATVILAMGDGRKAAAGMTEFLLK